jgi:transposase
MDRARYAVDAVVIEGRSLRSVASSLDMSKSWVAKQAALFRAGGYEALVPKSKAPHRRPTQLDGELENEIVMIRKQLSEDGFDAGPLTIQYHLRQRHGTAPGRSTIHRALVRRGFVVPQPQKRPKQSWVRFEANLPNETWQADMTHWSLADGTGVEILDFVDDYSRMVTVAVVLPVTTAADVVAAFYQGAGRFGLPASMLTDIQRLHLHRPVPQRPLRLRDRARHPGHHHQARQALPPPDPGQDRAVPPDLEAVAAQTGPGHVHRRAPRTGRLLRPLLQRDPAPLGPRHGATEAGLRCPGQGIT